MRTSLRETALRHATGLAVVVFVLTVAGFAAYLAVYRTVDGSGALEPDELLYSACQILPYGLVGSVLIARRPDLPFGWLLSLGAAALAVMLAAVGPSYWAIDSGRSGQLAVWGLTFGAFAFVPAAMEGLVNVRFPSGRPVGRGGRLLDRVLCWSIVAVLIGSLLGDSTVRAFYPDGVPGGAERFVDGTPVVGVGNALGVAVPAVILLGVLAGIGVVVRCGKAEGIERKQLQWRAAGVVGALSLFPFAVTETLPAWVVDITPLLFVVTLVVPVFRYDLWAIDSLIRRSAAYTLSSSGSVVDNMLRAVGEMLRLPYVGVRRGDRVVAAYGEPADDLESWPLIHEGRHVGELVAAPRRGLSSLGDPDRGVLATVAQLVAGSVRAEALTADLLAARHQLVAAREEERRRLRRDLHDGLGPLLTGLGLNLDAARASMTRDAERSSTYLGKAKEASNEVIASLRDLVYGLRPPALDDLGFAGAVRMHTERTARDAGIACELSIPDELALPAAVEVAAFRTIVEAVTNTVRHSTAQRVTVSVVESEDRLSVTICDDGRSNGEWRPGVGLTGMRERAEELGGQLTAGPVDCGGSIHAAFPLGRIPS